MTHNIYLCHNEEHQKLLGKYLSPDAENSTIKGIPMELQNLVLKLIPSTKRRIKYRGTSNPGYVRPQSNTIKKHADTFAVYYDNKGWRADKLNTILHLGAPTI